MTGQSKTKFRRTITWRAFRSSIIKARGCRCELCGRTKTSRGLDLHHLTPAVYSLLEPERFRLLCTGCHELVESFVFVAKSMPRAEQFYAWAGDFLPRKGFDL